MQNQLVLSGNFEHFQVHFQPLALSNLFGLPLSDLTNCNYPAHAVLGSAVSLLNQRLGEAHTFQERVQLADKFIASHSSKAPVHDSIELAANEILRHQGRFRIDSLAHYTGFSMRNFQRVFVQRVGVSPKLFSRIVRFETALRCKTAVPNASWTTIAQKCGFHDQMHLIHDFRLFSGGTPTGFSRNQSGNLNCGASLFSVAVVVLLLQTGYPNIWRVFTRPAFFLTGSV